MKRAVGILLMLALAAMPLQALASERNIGNELHRYSHFSDTRATAEYASNITSRDLEMEMGDYVMISPVHNIVTSLVSYRNTKATSSNPAVVAVRAVNQSTGNMGISLHALKAGEATVTLTFGTYLTRAGAEKYQDARGQKEFTQTVNVTVVDPGSVDVKVKVQRSDGGKLNGVSLMMVRLKDTLSSAQRQMFRDNINEALVHYSLLPLDTAWNYITGALKSGLVELGTTIAFSKVNGLPRALQTSHKGYTFAKDILGYYESALTSLYRFGKAYIMAKYASMQVPAYYPDQIFLKVTVENNTPYTVSDINVDLYLDDHLSIGNMTGPWRQSKTLMKGGQMAPGTSKDFVMPVFPRFVNGTLSPDGLPVPVYDTDIGVTCQYVIPEKSKGSLKSKKLKLPVYSIITKTELESYKKALWDQYNAARVDAVTSYMVGGAFNGYVRWFGYERFDQVFVFACPVEVVISRNSGGQLAVIAGEDDAFSDGVLTAFGVGETKYVVIPYDAVGDYSMSVRATGEGTMNVLTWLCDPDTGVSSKYYKEIPLKEGETFDMALYSDDASDVVRMDEAGGGEVLEPSASMDQQTILSEFQTRGFEAEAAEAYADLLLNGVEIDESLDAAAPVDRQSLAALLTGVVDAYYQGTENPEGEVEFDLPGEAEADAGAENLTVADGLIWADGLLDALGMVDRNTDWRWDYTEDAPVEESEEDPVETTEPEQAQRRDRGAGLSRSFGLDVGLDGDAPLTAGDALLIADAAMRCANDISARNTLIETLVEAYSNNLTWASNTSKGYLYGTDWTDGGAALPNYGMWNPVDYADLSITWDDVWLYYRLGKGLPGYRPCFCSRFEGIFEDSDRTVYRCFPFWYMNADGEIYRDEVYLAILATREGNGEAYLEANGIKAGDSDANALYFLVADQGAVAAVLGLTAPHTPEPEASEPAELSPGSEGLEAFLLNYRLYLLNYSDREATTAYDADLKEAVKSFQADHDLEQTGVADAQTQRLICAELENEQVIRDWTARHYSREGCKAAISAAIELSLTGQPETLARLMNGE